MDPAAAMPKVVWMLWLQGWDAAPPIVVACRDSWLRLNPGWQVRPLDAAGIRTLLPDSVDQGELTAAAYSDRLRLKLLSRLGGVWADATTYCHVPLDEWLIPRLGTEFFAFSAPAPGRKVSSWFLASMPASLIVRRWDLAADEYWRHRKEPDNYYWLHHLFGDLCRSDPTFDHHWRRTTSLPADGPHYFVPYRRRLTAPMTLRTQARLASRRDPLYKLTHKISEEAQPRSAYAYFIEGADTTWSPDARLVTLDRGLETARWVLRDSVKIVRARTDALRRAGMG